VAVISLEPVELIAGSLPRRQRRLVEAWAELHQEELLFQPLSELSRFNQVAIDPEVHTLVWPNGADFDPATLHDWPLHVDELAARARKWELQSA